MRWAVLLLVYIGIVTVAAAGPSLTRTGRPGDCTVTIKVRHTEEEVIWLVNDALSKGRGLVPLLDGSKQTLFDQRPCTTIYNCSDHLDDWLLSLPGFLFHPDPPGDVFIDREPIIPPYYRHPDQVCDFTQLHEGKCRHVYDMEFDESYNVWTSPKADQFHFVNPARLLYCDPTRNDEVLVCTLSP